MPPPAQPKIYHILHIDKLASVAADGFLWADAILVNTQRPGTVIGMNSIKLRRLQQLRLASHPGLFVGQCVPFYFCPRSIMLYLIYRANHEELAYHGGQDPILHLEYDLAAVAAWANQQQRRWAFTLSNAGANYFEDRCDLNDLDEIDWAAVTARKWSGPGVSSLVKEGKQAEFLVEHSVPWHLIERIGVQNRGVAQQVSDAIRGLGHRPTVELRVDWYY